MKDKEKSFLGLLQTRLNKTQSEVDELRMEGVQISRLI